ncbi:senescence-associated carboxylesterase 101-like [Syzygium oleosum]|uniref:senescence-associated carboxylesterase 101-like n=1 Tax=Syzygium oleosum TaxID=219896 RepID=UPI0024B8BEDB|nr:senescence-associated carboxylesterase 101-like [Syzygium oleosum]
MDRDGDPPFSNGLHLANLAVSSNLLQDSWNDISELERRINQHFLLRCVKRVFPQFEPATFRSYGNIPVIIDEFHHLKYNIIAFVTAPVTTGQLQEERDLVSSLDIPEFHFLCSENNSTFHINKAAISLFNSLQNKLSILKEKVVASANSEDSVPYIITGHCLGGSIASLFTLWILNKLDATKRTLPLCITFGSPLLGDSAFQQAISQYSTWNSCFLHVVHKDDCFPRLFLHPPTTNPSQYKPFCTFLLCSESGAACFEAPESVMELLTSEIVVGNRESQSVDYKNVIGCLEQRLIHYDCSRLNGQEADSYKAGVLVGLKSIQQQNEVSDALIEDIVKHERGVIRRQREAFDPAKKLDEMKVYLAFLEWYMKVCKANGQGPGYYDSFKNARERRDNGVDKYKTILTDYWERVVTEADKKPQVWGTPLRNRWLFGGTNYRRIVEPLDIAEYYKRGRKDYLNRGRSEHYKLLQKWLEDHPKEKSKEQAGPSNSKLKNIESSVTEDSCFWAHVEEAIRSCRLLESGGSSNSSERAKLIEFEKYVMGLIKECKVSPDIFLEKSSYMQWWREYVEILKRPMMGDSQNSPLVAFMGDEPYKNYAKGSPRMFQEGHSNVNPPDSSNASLRSTEGRKISPSSFSLQFSLRFLSLSLVLLLSLCLCLFLFLSYFSR